MFGFTERARLVASEHQLSLNRAHLSLPAASGKEYEFHQLLIFMDRRWHGKHL